MKLINGFLIVLLVLGFFVPYQAVRGQVDIPAGATITSATLSVNRAAYPTGTINVHRITQPWEETVVTWNSFGSSFDPTVIASLTPVNGVGWKTADVTSLVQAWVDGTYPNYGFLLDEVNQSISNYYSSESSSTSLRPKLDVCYTAPGVPETCVTIQRSGSTAVDVVDTYVWEFTPTTNYGRSTRVWVGFMNNREKFGLIRFDFALTVVEEPAVEIVKRTNGQVASDPNGADVPRLLPGDSVTWTYQVTNTGNVSVPRADVVVTDDQPGVTPTFSSEESGNGDDLFDPGEVWLFTATGTVIDLTNPPAGVTTVPGVCTANGTHPPSTAYVNTGMVEIPGASDTAPSSYCNETPGIQIVKYTNGQVANDPDGADVPRLVPGQPVTWTYEVTNTGAASIPRAQVIVTDDQPGVTPVFDSVKTGDADDLFEPGEVWLYTATGTALDLTNPPDGVTTVDDVCTAEGVWPPATAYVNMGKVEIPGASATAPSSYCNATPGIQIVKYTNGQVASDPDGADVPHLIPGQPVTWIYEVINNGTVAVPRAQVIVTDDQPGVTPVFDRVHVGNADDVLDPGEIWHYIATGVAFDLTNPPDGVTTVPGVCTDGGMRPPSTAYVNTGTVQIPGDSASAPSSYCNEILQTDFKYFVPITFGGPESVGFDPYRLTIGYEDLPRNGKNDYDYNDWILDIQIVDELSNSLNPQFTFNFRPNGRGATFRHAYFISVPPNTFTQNGTATLTIFDQNGQVVGTPVTNTFNASQAMEYEIFSNTATVFPNNYSNTIEGVALEPPRRTAMLRIEFPGPTSFLPQRSGLWFDSFIRVLQTGDIIRNGDIRMLVVPDLGYLWPEERVRIDVAYEEVIFGPGDPPSIIFLPEWWLNFNTCVIDGKKCVP